MCEMIGLVDEGSGYCLPKLQEDFQYCLLTEELQYELDEQSVQRTENWLNGQAQSLLGGHYLVEYLRRQYQVQSCLKSSLMIWPRGQSTPSAGLQMRQSWEECLAHQRGVLPSGGTWAGWRIGLTGIHEGQQGEAQRPALGNRHILTPHFSILTLQH